ncbi:MAG TPA: hypothetical protein VGN99_01585 [Steroidobacteraceae bacterium]|nr:hypothetical protein [Steroidobacteraceae bacterium]
MSPLPIPSAVTATLPAANIHPHAHGHKKGTPLDPSPSPGSTSGTSAPVGSTQNLFSRLFSSLQQLIGARPVPAAANPLLSASAAAGPTAATAPKLNVMA